MRSDFTRFCCVDIETTGTSPDRAAVIQIAAARFNLETQEIDHRFFNRCLAIPPTRFWEEGTRSWWMSHRDTLASIYERMEDPRTVMADFHDWVNQVPGTHFLSKPLSFDFPFISSYAIEFGLGQNPFDFRRGRDLRSLISVIAPEFNERSVPFDGNQHDAMFDVFHQIKMLFKATEESPVWNLIRQPVLDLSHTNQASLEV
jgi:hypothetical protein